MFYDYDEIEYLTDCNFRKVPEARNEEDEMSGEVWYPVGPKDVFPETFGPFLLGNPSVREVFMAHHADLLDAAFWQGHKERILAGYVHDVFPYDAAQALRTAARRPGRRVATAPSLSDSSKEPTMADSIVIVSAARTPIGGLLGDFSALAAHRARRASPSRPRSSAPASPATPSTRC